MRRSIASVVALAALPLSCGGAPRPLPPPPPSPSPVASWPATSSSPPPPLTTPDAPFRDGPPAAGSAVAWIPPKIETWSLANGVRVFFVERHDLPIVSVRVLSTAGAGDVPAKPGIVSFMGAMLEQGAGKRSALALSDDYEALGAEHGTWADWDQCGAHAKVLASRLAPALDMLADVVLHPTFPEAEIERLRKRWLASIEQEKSNPSRIEQNAIGVALFGHAHPYGHSQHEVASAIEKLTRADVESAWRRVFAPRSTAIVVAGDVSADGLRTMLQARFGAWAGGAAARAPVPHAPAPAPKGARSVSIVDLAGAAQSQVYVVAEGPSIGTPDRVPITVMNLILGGMFSSRINIDLREAHAYTYGAFSRFSMRHGAGPFTAGGAMFADHTGDAVRELLTQVDRIRAEPVTTDELADAKEHAKLALPARFESVEEVTHALQEIATYGLPLDEYATLSVRIDAVTAADVQRVAKQWLHPEAMRVVVTGDRAKIEKDLTAYGSIETRDAYGDVVK
jgi:zinc protease